MLLQIRTMYLVQDTNKRNKQKATEEERGRERYYFDRESKLEKRNDTLKERITLNEVSIQLVSKSKKQIKLSISSFKNQRLEFSTMNSALK